MAQAMYAVVNNSTKRIKNSYCVVGGVTKKIKAVYAVIDGKTKLVWTTGSFPFTGVVYSYANHNSTKNFGLKTWNGELFINGPSVTVSNQTDTYDAGTAFSKNGRLALTSTYSNTNPQLGFYKWNQNSQTYTNMTTVNVGSYLSISPTGYWQCYLSGSSWIKSDGSQVVVAVYFTANSSSYYNSSYTSYFDTYKKYASNYLLFFDINLEDGAVSFSKGVYLQYGMGAESVPGYNDSYVTSYMLKNIYFSENDDYAICALYKDGYLGGSSYYYKYTYFYNIDPVAKTATKINTSDNYIEISSLSNCGHYAFGKVYTPTEDDDYNTQQKIFYLKDNTITSVNNNLTYSYGVMTPKSVYTLPEKNIMYILYYDSLYTYSTNTTTLTRIGSFNLNLFYSNNAFTIHDINDVFILLSGQADSDGFLNTNLCKTVCCYIQQDASNKITSVEPSWNVTNYSSGVLYSNGAKIIDKTNLVASNNGKTTVNFNSSTSWTVPSGVTSIDIMCIGGGGGAGGSSYENETDLAQGTSPSGAGGYTSVVRNITVTPGETLTITIGSGGAGGKGYYYYQGSDGDVETNGVSTTTAGSAGGASSVINSTGTTLCLARGGNGGLANPAGSIVLQQGASGGSGSGAAGGYLSASSGAYISTDGGRDGKDGMSGGSASLIVSGFINGSAAGGSGQGSTTREWGSPLGTLYSSAGGNKSTAPTANTGHGGDSETLSATVVYQMSGASGKVLIRY